MKKLIVAIVIVSGLFISSCGNQNGTKEAGNASPANDTFVNKTPSAASGPAGTNGANLIARNDCKTCHNTDTKSIGPSYTQIANKYDNNDAMADELAEKIVKGGYGRWGQVAMKPHPETTIPEAREMASYILSLKTANQ